MVGHSHRCEVRRSSVHDEIFVVFHMKNNYFRSQIRLCYLFRWCDAKKTGKKFVSLSLHFFSCGQEEAKNEPHFFTPSAVFFDDRYYCCLRPNVFFLFFFYFSVFCPPPGWTDWNEQKLTRSDSKLNDECKPAEKCDKNKMSISVHAQKGSQVEKAFHF